MCACLALYLLHHFSGNALLSSFLFKESLSNCQKPLAGHPNPLITVKPTHSPWIEQWPLFHSSSCQPYKNRLEQRTFKWRAEAFKRNKQCFPGFQERTDNHHVRKQYKPFCLDFLCTLERNTASPTGKGSW